MRALSEAGLPVPRVVAMGALAEVDGRPFILLERVDGERIEAVAGSVTDERLAMAAVAALRRVHELPTTMTGIGDEAAMTLEDELARWTRLIGRGPADLITLAPRVIGRLSGAIPAPSPPVLVHGDYQYGNLLFKDGEIAGIIDWEVASLGHRQIDVAMLQLVADASSRGLRVPGGTPVHTGIELVADAYGTPLVEITWFLGLAYFKMAAIFAFNAAMHRSGKRPDPHNERRARDVGAYLEAALDVLGTLH